MTVPWSSCGSLAKLWGQMARTYCLHPCHLPASQRDPFHIFMNSDIHPVCINQSSFSHQSLWFISCPSMNTLSSSFSLCINICCLRTESVSKSTQFPEDCSRNSFFLLSDPSLVLNQSYPCQRSCSGLSAKTPEQELQANTTNIVIFDKL